MCVGKADVFEYSVLALAQVPGFSQRDTVSFYALTEDVFSLAHTLSSKLVWRRKKIIRFPLKSDRFVWVEFCGT